MAAKVCPYCHRDTTESGQAHGSMMLGAIIGGVIGYFVNGIWGMFIGIIVGGTALGIGPILKASKSPAPPASVSVDRIANEPPPASRQLSLAQRLTSLDEVRAKGLITDEEFAKKKADILKKA
ncbi:SHOCT domain-containing protein [Ramlibacter henchirensis]|nr:SHOCT domain-containing protein [Ramlibacter henchirensis]